jgi:leucyl aminopeptidase (aminopeptidase T)
MQPASIAKKVVKECLQVKEDEQVLIQTWDHTLELSNALALEIYQAGATPLIALSTDELFLGYVTKVPEKYYVKRPRAFLSLLDEVDASVWLFGPKDPKILKMAPEQRMVKSFEAENTIIEKYIERRIRTVNLPVGYVTSERAQTYGLDLLSWRRNFDHSLDVDMEKMSELGKKLALRLQNARKVHITHDAGTDLTFSIGERPVFVRDGIIDTEDISKGNITETLPSGTITVAPLESSAEGTIFFDKARAFMGKMVDGLKLVFQRGRVASFLGKNNVDTFASFYSGGGGDKDRIGWFSIGLNPKAVYMGLSTDELLLGGTTIGIGYNKEVGGNNNATISYAQTLTEATIEVDGRPLVLEGKIQV